MSYRFGLGVTNELCTLYLVLCFFGFQIEFEQKLLQSTKNKVQSTKCKDLFFSNLLRSGRFLMSRLAIVSIVNFSHCRRGVLVAEAGVIDQSHHRKFGLVI